MCGSDATNKKKSSFDLALKGAAAFALVGVFAAPALAQMEGCLLYTSDAADDLVSG